MPRDIAISKTAKKPPREVVTAQHALSKLKINSTDISADDMAQLERLVPGLAVALKRSGHSVTQPILINHCKQGVEHVKTLMKQLRTQQLAPVLKTKLSYESLLEKYKDKRPVPPPIYQPGDINHLNERKPQPTPFLYNYDLFLSDIVTNLLPNESFTIDRDIFENTEKLLDVVETRFGFGENENATQFKAQILSYLLLRSANEGDTKTTEKVMKILHEAPRLLSVVFYLCSHRFIASVTDITKDLIDVLDEISLSLDQAREDQIKLSIFLRLQKTGNIDVIKYFIDKHIQKTVDMVTFQKYIHALTYWKTFNRDYEDVLDHFFSAANKNKTTRQAAYEFFCALSFNPEMTAAFQRNISIDDIEKVDLEHILVLYNSSHGTLDLPEIFDLHKKGKLYSKELEWYKKNYKVENFTAIDRLALYLIDSCLMTYHRKNAVKDHVKLLIDSGWKPNSDFYRVNLERLLKMNLQGGGFIEDSKIDLFDFLEDYPDFFTKTYKKLTSEHALRLFKQCLKYSESFLQILLKDDDFMNRILAPAQNERPDLEILEHVLGYLLYQAYSSFRQGSNKKINNTIKNIHLFIDHLEQKNPEYFKTMMGDFFISFTAKLLENSNNQKLSALVGEAFMPYLSQSQYQHFDLLRLMNQNYFEIVDLALQRGMKLELPENLRDKWQHYLEWKKTGTPWRDKFLAVPAKIYIKSVYDAAERALNKESDNYTQYAVHACVFKTPQQLWKYLDRWGAFGRNAPLHDLLQAITVPKTLHDDFDRGAWAAAIMRHGPKMGRLFQYANRIPKPFKGADGGWSYTKTLEEIAKFAYARSSTYPIISGLAFRYKWREEKFEEAVKLSEKYLEKYKANDNKKPTHIPEITIDGKEFGKESVIFRKLPDGDIRGLFLGEMTDCCQHLNSAGHKCAAHGFLEYYGGFYVLENQKGDIVAQMWAWRGTQGELVLDSFEQLRGHFNSKQVEGMLELFAEKSKTADTETPVTRILIGTSGETPRDMKFATDSSPASPIDYAGYRDSNHQYLIRKFEVQ